MIKVVFRFLVGVAGGSGVGRKSNNFVTRFVLADGRFSLYFGFYFFYAYEKCGTVLNYRG